MSIRRNARSSSSRREFLASAAVAGLTASRAARAADVTAPSATAAKKARVCIFTKYLQSRNWQQLGEAVSDLGYVGVDLTVRSGGHVLPEKVADDLPKAHEALKKAGVEITMITTNILSAEDKHAEATLKAAAALGVRYAKLGYYEYKDLKDVPQLFADVKAKLRGLVPLFAQYGIAAGFHNHSGRRAGAMLWDEWELIRDLDPKWIGSYFDPCHATIEGGLGGWEIGLNLLAPRITMLAVKDFEWKKSDKGWRPEICSLGAGRVQWRGVLGALKAHRFAGPISTHIEYGEQGKPGSPEEKGLFAAIRTDLKFLREQLRQAGIDAA